MSRRERIRRWSQDVCDENAAYITLSLPFRRRVRLYAALALAPHGFRALAAYFRARFLRWAVLPGDVWVNIPRDKVAVIWTVRRDRVIAEVASGLLIARAAGKWPDEYPLGCAPAFEDIPDSDWTWVPR